MPQRAWDQRYAQADPIVIGDSVREAWDLEAARESAVPGNLFPSRVGWSASARVDPLRATLDGQAASGYRSFPAEIVAVPKSFHATRPAADLATEDQLLYAAIISALRQRIPAGLVKFTDDGEQSYEEFEQFPLTQPGTRYVVEGDAASFFQYVDYELLAYELIGLTGWSDAVEALIRLLQTWMAEHRGIPQGPEPSRALGDIYISPVARVLHRSGWNFSRYTDDFRIAAPDWQAARAAHLALENALGAQRLVPAANKTRTYKVATYQQRIDKANAPRLVAQASKTAFEGIAGEYVAAMAGRFEVSPEEVVLAEHVISEQVDLLSSDPIGTRLLRWSLGVLGNGGSNAALPLLPRLLDRQPQVTQAIAGYLTLLMGTPLEQRALQAAVSWLGETSFRFDWQIGWVLHSLNFAEAPDQAAGQAARRLFDEISMPWFVHGQAAIACAVHGRLPEIESFVSVYELSPRATRPDLVAAVILADPDWAGRFLTGVTDSPLLAAVAQLDPERREEWL